MLHLRFRYSRFISIGRFLFDVMLSVVAFCVVTLLPLVSTFGLEKLFTLKNLWTHLGIFALAAGVALYFSRTYRMIWRYVSFQDLLTLIQAAAFTTLGFVTVEFFMFRPQFSTSLFLLASTVILVWTADIGFLAAPRLIARLIGRPYLFPARNRSAISTSVLVTGDASRIESFLRECRADPASRYRIVGVLLDDPRLHGSYLDGVQVLGGAREIKLVLALLRQKLPETDMPTALVFAKDNATRADFEYLLQLTASTGIKVGRLPRHGTLQSNARSTVEPIALPDLLGRPEVVGDSAAVAMMVENKCVMVTGAGGSIGSELTRQIAGFKPALLAILDFSEFNLYTIDKELEETHPLLNRKTILVDMRDGNLVSRWIRDIKPDIVFHAAALKHVPLVEEYPVEGMKTNVIGTINVAEACCANAVPAMVTISTDKAVNPCNVMGATKRLAEAYCQALDQSKEYANSTRFITVRFGNVLGSAGSVVPLFQRQIESGGPVTVTHGEIRRFFMTIPEAVTLVLQAGAQGINMNEERGSIYVLDMGEPIKIIDLARQMIRLSGRLPDVDIKVKIVGLRAGEKLYEEVAYSDEEVLPTQSKSIVRLKPRTTDLRILQQQVQEMRQACAVGDYERALRVLRLSVPEYSSDEVPSALHRQSLDKEA